MGCHVTPGTLTDQSPYRSKLSGIYAILCVAKELCDLYSITTSGLIIGCDHKKNIWMAIDKKGSLSPKSKSFDLISAIQHKIGKLPIPSPVTGSKVTRITSSPTRHASIRGLHLTLKWIHWQNYSGKTHIGRPTRQDAIHDETHAIYVLMDRNCVVLSRINCTQLVKVHHLVTLGHTRQTTIVTFAPN
jgi:hypothetical protein